MKVRTSLTTLAVVAVVGLTVSVAGDGEYHNCGVCKPMMEEPGLMQHVRGDSQKISTGMISVTSVDKGYGEAFDRAHDKMMMNVARMEKGEKLELCPMCRRMGALQEAGATIENVNVAGTRVMAVTSGRPEVIAKIHDHHEWALKEFAGHDDGHGGKLDHDRGGKQDHGHDG